MSINIKSPSTYINATVVGTPTISEGVVSGFSSANYLTISGFTPSVLAAADTWEVVTCFTTNSTGNCVISGNSGTFAPDFGRIKNGKFAISYSSNGTSYNISGADGLNGTYEVLLNTKYWVRQRFTGTEYTLEYSLDGKDYITDITVTNSTKIESTTDTLYLGCSTARAPYDGSIDLNQSYIKINGEYWWRGVEVDQYREIKRLYYSGSSLIKQVYKTDKELIPQLVYEHNPTVFQQSTAGTYTFNVTEEAPYEITLVGGGGGGAFNSSGNAGSAAAGNSGSGLVVIAVLKAGTYILNVGAGGAWAGHLDANVWGGNGSQSSISKDGVVIATAGGGTGNHCWWRSGSAHNSTVGAAPTYTDALGVTDVILNRQGNWGGLAATSSGGASVISGTTWGKGGNTRDRNAADNGNAGCIKIVRMSYVYLTVNAEPDEATIKVNGDML